MQDGIKPSGCPVGACSLGQVGDGQARRLYRPAEAGRKRLQPPAYAETVATSSFRPGPMVELSEIFLM